jgi:hypothetical protein
MADESLHRQNLIACVWDFDRTLIEGYMQAPIFAAYDVDERDFWEEVNGLPEIYQKRGIRVSAETVYLNHILSGVRDGRFRGLNNPRLRELGRQLRFYPGIPDLLAELKAIPQGLPACRRHNIQLEHYIISTGLAEMIRGSAIAEHVDGIFGSEFIENPVPSGYREQNDLPMEIEETEIAQIGFMVDNTIKTRFIFEINKGCNRNPEIDVNAKVAPEDRRIPLRNMIYIADGPSDIPVFSVVKKNGGKAFAVFDPETPGEFEQNDNLLQTQRIHAYGPADYREGSMTARWLKMHVARICDRIAREQELAVTTRVGGPPRHLHREDKTAGANGGEPLQELLLDEASES